MHPNLTGALALAVLAAGCASARPSAAPETTESKPPPTYADVSYGPHARNVMDVWLARSDLPTPVLVSIHGGGFRGGNKNVDAGILEEALASGISVVAITYRLSADALAPAQFQDAARAIQFIRHRAGEWNLDPTRIAATGGSAGAGLSQWLGFHDDMANPRSADPVERQSTRLTAMAVWNAQTSYDPRFIRELIPENDTYNHPALVQLYGADLSRPEELPRDKLRIIEETAPINHVTADDPPVLIAYPFRRDQPITDQGVGIHHPRFGFALKERMDALGIEAQVHTEIDRREEWPQLAMAFIKRHFGMEP